jgi:hypothetical protein
MFPWRGGGRCPCFSVRAHPSVLGLFVGSSGMRGIDSFCAAAVTLLCRDGMADYIGELEPTIMNPNALPMYREAFEYVPVGCGCGLFVICPWCCLCSARS